MTVYEIIQELNEENGSNHKIAVLKKHADNDLLKRVLKMTYDTCTFTYGISMKNVQYTPDMPLVSIGSKSLDHALDVLENEFVTRVTTGNAAIERLEMLFASMFRDDAEVLRGVINRDLRINMGRSNINKVFKGLIVKPVYMRCDTYNDKTKKDFNPEGSFIELKADGTYREFQKEGDKITCQSRSGESYTYPLINEVLSQKPDGVYFGELTVYRDGILLDRSTGNGILRKNVIPEGDHIMFDTWDYVTLEEYSKVATRDANDKKQKGTTPFKDRRAKIQEWFPSYQADPLKHSVRAVESHEVNSRKEALIYVQKWMNDGLEGGIWKEESGVFMDSTSKQQLKLKLEIEVEVRFTGYIEGTPGTVREKTFGSMTYETDDGKIKGSVSGFTNKQLEEINSNREAYVGIIGTLLCNDITKGKNNDFHALSHPRIQEFRFDRTDTDTLERALDSKKMAMELENDL